MGFQFKLNAFLLFWRLKSQPKVDDHFILFSVQAHYLYRHRKPSRTRPVNFFTKLIQPLFLWRTCTLPPILVQAKLSIRCNVVLPCGLLTQNGWCSPLPRTRDVQRPRHRSATRPKQSPTPNVPSEPGLFSMFYRNGYPIQIPSTFGSPNSPVKRSECLLSEP